MRAGGALGPQRQLDLALGREAIELPRPEVAHGGGAGLLGQAVVLVGVRDPCGLGRRGSDVAEAGIAQVGAVGVAGPPVEKGTNAHPAARRVGEALDRTAVDPDLALDALLGVALGVARPRRDGRLDHAARGRLEVRAQAAVPPTVSAPMRTCGCPTPAATR